VEIDLAKALRVMRAVNTAGDFLEGKRKLKRALDTHGDRMGTAMDVTEAARKVATGDIDRYDFRVGCKAAVRHSPKIYRFAARKIAERKAREAKK